MRGEPILELRSVTKYMCRDTRRAQRYGLADIAREFVPFARERTALREGEFASVDDVSFSVAAGEALAIMGENGAGKTTLLRMIAGLIKPDRGEVRVNCRVNSVIELGQGINPELTGRENAELGLAWRGVGQRDASTLMMAIAEFAELSDAWDSPVSTYSTGMRMRLAFAIAIHVPGDLLLLDEVLAVGDLDFQQKCFRAMQALLAEGCSIILVSHNVSQMQTVCRRGLLIDRGRVMFDGPVAEAIDRMLELSTMQRADEVGRTANASALRITSLRAASADGSPSIRTGSDLDIRIDYVAAQELQGRFVCIFRTEDLAVCISMVSEPAASTILPGKGSRVCRIPNIPFSPGRFAIQASISDPETLYAIATWGYANRPTVLHVIGEIAREDVLRRSMRELIQLPGSWTSFCDQHNVSQAWPVETVMVDE